MRQNFKLRHYQRVRVTSSRRNHCERSAIVSIGTAGRVRRCNEVIRLAHGNGLSAWFNYPNYFRTGLLNPPGQAMIDAIEQAWFSVRSRCWREP